MFKFPVVLGTEQNTPCALITNMLMVAAEFCFVWARYLLTNVLPYEYSQPCILVMMDVVKNTGLPQLHNSHLWLLVIGSAHRWPHHGTSPRLAC